MRYRRSKSERRFSARSAFVATLCATGAAIVAATPGRAAGESARSDRYALHAIFAEQHVEESAFHVHRRAAAMSAEQRFEYLAKWVLPGPTHSNLRLALDFVPTNPAPPIAESYSMDDEAVDSLISIGNSRIQTGGCLISPAIDLIETARKLKKLDEVRTRIEHALADGELQQRRRFALLVLTDIARREFESARAGLDALAERVRNHVFAEFPARWPETLAVWVAIDQPETREAARDLLFSMLQDQVRSGYANGPDEWDRMVTAMAGRIRDFEHTDSKENPNTRFGARSPIEHWAPISRTTALTRGRGFPCTQWRVSPGLVEKLAGHNEDYLLYRLPLRGNFEVECDVSTFGWRDCHLSAAGTWVAAVPDHTSYAIGEFRSARPPGAIDPRLSRVDEWLRYRVVVRDGVCTTYFNGRPIHRERLPAEHDPWLAIRSPWFANSEVRGLRITGKPVVPAHINISALGDLTGWTAYFDESVGGVSSDWRQLGNLQNGGGIVGRRKPNLAGSHQESLLRYQRPLLEDGTIEYDFYYSEGRSHVHPALDRRAFLLQPDGVRIHWITDGVYDRTGLDPANIVDETQNRRGPSKLPLKQNDWNRLRLKLTGDVVDLILNEQLIYRGALEPTNQRTFGLFHYSDRTEARVRNIVWTGNWPRELPSVAEQELAGEGTDELDERLEELTAKFQHDFARDGLPSRIFEIYTHDAERQHMTAKPDGLHVTAASLNDYSPTYIAPQLRVHGDFDIVATFDGLTTTAAEDGSGGISLRAILEESDEEQSTVYRGFVRRTGLDDQQLIQSFSARKTSDDTRMVFQGTTSEAATSGRLRLARCGDKISCLFAEADSTYYRLVAQETFAKGPLRVDGVRLTTATQGETGSTGVVWKDLTIRAERITNAPIQNPEKLLEELNEQRDALAAHFHHDFAKDLPAAERFRSWRVTDQWKQTPHGWQIVAPGRDEWLSSGMDVQRGLRGDFDISFAFETPVFDKPQAGDNSAVFLHVESAEEPPTHASAILLQQPDGTKQVAAELRTPTRDGNKFQRLRTQSVESAGRLRMARRGKTLLFLFADDATKPFRILTQTEFTDKEIPPSSIQIFAHTGGAGRETQVLCKTLEIHAAEIAEPAKNTGEGEAPAEPEE